LQLDDVGPGFSGNPSHRLGIGGKRSSTLRLRQRLRARPRARLTSTTHPKSGARSPGRIRSVDRYLELVGRWGPMVRFYRGRVLRPRRTGNNACLNVMTDGRRNLEIGRGVALAFHGEPPSEEHEAARIDGDGRNNRPGNWNLGSSKLTAPSIPRCWRLPLWDRRGICLARRQPRKSRRFGRSFSPARSRSVRCRAAHDTPVDDRGQRHDRPAAANVFDQRARVELGTKGPKHAQHAEGSRSLAA